MAACFDWSVAAPDAGSDATLDAPWDASFDAGKDVDDGATVTEASVCPTLAADLASKRDIAEACGAPGEPCFGFLDECACGIGVADLDGGATAKYGVAISNFVEAGCANCGPCAVAADASWTCNTVGDANVCTQ